MLFLFLTHRAAGRHIREVYSAINTRFTVGRWVSPLLPPASLLGEKEGGMWHVLTSVFGRGEGSMGRVFTSVFVRIWEVLSLFLSSWVGKRRGFKPISPSPGG